MAVSRVWPGGLIDDMTTPIKPLPVEIHRWIARARWLRGADAVAAWLGLWAVSAAALGPASARLAAALSLALLCLGLILRPIRILWRPISAGVGLAVSRGLHAGNRAWYVRSSRADLVLVTARHGTRLVIAPPDLDADEVLSVRRTRVLLLPADETGAS
jgi:hypothetical protein